MSKTEIATAFDTVLEALVGAGVAMDDREEYLLMTIDGKDYRIDINEWDED